MGDRWRVRGALVIAGAILTAGVACNRSEDPPATTTTAAAETTLAPATTAAAGARTTNPKLLDVSAAWTIDGNRNYTDEEKKIVEAYVRAEQAIVKARLNPVDTELTDSRPTMTDRYLETLKGVVTDDVADGRAVTDPSLFAILTGRLQRDSPVRAVIQACYVSNSHPYEIATGRLLEEDEPFAKYRAAEMALVDGVWKLDLRGEVKSWPGLPRCADPLP